MLVLGKARIESSSGVNRANSELQELFDGKPRSAKNI